MESLETGKDKVKKICEVLRKETLEPALEEAEGIVREAKEKADALLQQAQAKSQIMLQETEKEIAKRQGIFDAALKQGARQLVEWLKQEIEGKVLHENLYQQIVKATRSKDVMARLIETVIKAVEEDGLAADLSVVIPSAMQPREINEMLGKELLEKLKEKSVIVGPMQGGIEIKLRQEKMTIDLSDKALLDLLMRFVRKDFHDYFFASK